MTLLDDPPPPADTGSEYAIIAKGLTKKFNSFTAVDHVNLKVEKGTIFGYLGPNGAGKSTTIRMLCTLLTPSSGTATIAGYDLTSQPAEIRHRIGLVAEKLILYPRLSAVENLMFFGRMYGMEASHLRKRIDELLELVQLTPFKDKLIGGFSSGMRQRVNIIRGLLHNPEILFLDEPSNALDPQSTRFVRDLVKELKAKGHTIILTTHIMEEADELSDRIEIIDHGKIIGRGSPRELKDKFNADNMLDVFLSLTGRGLRDSASDRVVFTGA
jgi:ABC-2 type transport system ATP-binding protein